MLFCDGVERKLFNLVFQYADRMEKVKPSPIRELLPLASKPGVITFAGGWPTTETFPLDAIKACADRALDKYKTQALQYGPTEGIAQLRECIAQRMKSYGVEDAAAEDIMLTSGSQQGIEYAAKLLINPGDVVICENPTYTGTIGAFNQYGPKYVPIEMDHDGMKMDALEKALQENPNARMIYTIPDFQNPTGITMSLERRYQLLALAEKYGVPIVEDSPYYEIYFGGERIPPLRALDRKGVVIYLGSFSKTFCPGLRLGWILAPHEVIRKFHLIKQGADLQVNSLAQYILYHFLTDYDFDEQCSKVRKVYERHRESMIGTMEKEFPDTVSFTRPRGGMFVWATLPEGVKSNEVFLKAVEQKVAFVPGDGFFPNGGDDRHIRLSYGTPTEENIVEGIKRLGKVLREL